jgi:hypothetical protein
MWTDDFTEHRRRKFCLKPTAMATDQYQTDHTDISKEIPVGTQYSVLYSHEKIIICPTDEKIALFKEILFVNLFNTEVQEKGFWTQQTN